MVTSEHRKELEEALEAMMNCERWEFKTERQRDFLDALDRYIAKSAAHIAAQFGGGVV